MLAGFFEWLSGFVCRKARVVIAATVAMSVVCSLGLLHGRVVSDEDALYLPDHSHTVKELNWIERTYSSGNGQTGGAKSLSMYCATPSSSNVVTREAMVYLFELIDELWSSEPKGSATSLADVAHLNAFGYPMESSPYGYWNKSIEEFLDDEDWRETLRRQPTNRMGLTDTYDANGDAFPTRIPLDFMFGDVKIENEEVVEAEAIQVKLWVRNDLVTNAHLRAADRVVLRKLKRSDDHLRCYLHTHTSYRDAVLGAIQHDMKLVAVSVSLLALFATACFSGRRKRRRRAPWLLGPVAMISVLLALSSAFGLWMAFGGYFHNLMGAVLFMVLGLGVDDAFVVVEAVDYEIEQEAANNNNQAVSSVDQLISRAMRNAGASILVTSTTDASAFAACAWASSIPAVQSFCAVAAISIALDFFFQITFFVAVVSLTVRSPPSHEALASSSSSGEYDEDFSTTPRHSTMSQRLADAILSRHGRFVALSATAVLVALGAVGSSRLRMEYESKWLAPSGSMVRDAYEVEDKYFSDVNEAIVKVFSRHDEAAPLFERLDEYRRAVDDLRALPWHESDKFWLDRFDTFVEDDPAVWEDERDFDARSSLYALMGKRYSDRLVFSPQNETEFTTARCSALNLPRQDFADDPEATMKVVVDEKLALCATRIELRWSKVSDKSEQLRRIDAAQKLLPAFMFVSRSPSLEALSLVWDSVKLSVALVALAVAASCLVLFGKLWPAILMLGVVAIIDVVLLGSLYWIGEYINMVTNVILTLAVGLSVDFSAHYTHAFLHSTHPQSRTHDALDRMLAPIAKGAGSTLLAVAPMAASTSYVIRLFCIICALIIFLGFFMGIFFVPALLHSLTLVLDPHRNQPLVRNNDRRNNSNEVAYNPLNSPPPDEERYESDTYNENKDDKRNADSRLTVLELCRTDNF